ncbi:MAG: DUF2851 family protein [Cyclobacteriaceae bacterium]|nr:DUF2851 family protein [Cyclobacteriaceae bacterium]
MTETFLHYIWQFQYFNKTDLQTVDGESIQVFHPGVKNIHAGPDFTNARIKIGELEWRGNVELHIQSSGWLAHQHQYDSAYEPVILHVVWEYDKPVVRNDGSVLPTMELKGRVDESLWKRYRQLFTSPENIPCAPSLKSVTQLVRLSMQERTVVERLEKKAAELTSILTQCNNDWDEAVYRLLGKNFGFKVNAEPFLQLTSAVPLKLLLRHADHPLQVEALLFGMSGLLDETKTDQDYTHALRREFDLLQHKFKLADKKMHAAQWRFLRLRPANFPTLRIAQFAAIIISLRNFLSVILETDSLDALLSLLSVRQSPFWLSHYHFGKPASKVPALGIGSIRILIINTVIPVLAAYARAHDQQEYMDRAIRFLHQLPAERNSTIQNWKEAGWQIQSAFDSQSLLELYNTYCKKRRCLECQIGASLIKPR